MSSDPMTPAEPNEPLRPALSRTARRRNQVIAVTALVAVWVLLWGTLSWANIIGGLVVAAVLLAVFPLPPVTFAGRIHPLPMLRFWLHFLRDLVVASAQVAWLAMRVGHTPQSAIIAARLRVNTDLNLTLTAEALSLLPGSLILEADRRTGTLYIHVLGVTSRDEVERFRRGVLELEARIVEAIGSPEELRRIRENPADREGVPA
ncbi:Na+/H+ antiporter subunit E [Micromonospora sediminimaris]|uniref:Na+/H+ antiporter subunit E n=1 Tax=Micromonospora sediminimaris TaxID=547162 RepID=A0A9W5XHV2_9ACTN|nr:Na+/H+ antiporter subunit E [Micromonospora sediminimaris]GIJ31144.1 Na+/H+ antiporter subunit E [Micromonospora sediminimaris]SFC24368.1 multicomponent Na+:H+ antiporter subunit E [Micromonospora sediminimaris]